MSHFKHFPKVLYNFGNEIEATVFQKLGTYVDIIDQVIPDIKRKGMSGLKDLVGKLLII